MDIDVDPNADDADLIYQIADDRIYLIVFVSKDSLKENRIAASLLGIGDEAVFGKLRCGEQVWIARDDDGYRISIGDSDSKDVSYKISHLELNQLLTA